MSDENQTQEGPKKVTLSTIEGMLDQGMTREDIAEELNTTVYQLNKTIFQHPKLKGRKPKKAPEFVLVDDSEDVAKNVSADDQIGNSPVTQEESDENKKEVSFDQQ